MKRVRGSPALTGGLLALLAAALFGLSTPLVQRFGAAVGPFTTAWLLYGGAALVAVLLRQPAAREAQLRRTDLPRLLAMALTGAVLGPVALAWGLQRTSGSSASLMLALEAVFTAVLAWRWYGETMDRRVALAVLLLVAGGLALVVEQRFSGQIQMLGLLAVLAATVAWGVDNTLSRGVAERDPGQVVVAKSLLGAAATLTLAGVMDEPWPGWRDALALLLVGASGYGLSLRFYLLAQRAFGAGRTGSVFGFAPFIGAVGALALGDRALGWGGWLGGALMLAGVLLHLAEQHDHAHDHVAMEHEHAHTHDDGHHDHVHDHHHGHHHGHHDAAAHAPAPGGAHSHWHRHEPLRHAHAHVPDVHHQHPHPH